MPDATKLLRVWHIPQIPGKPFRVSVSGEEEARKIMAVLGAYDAFEFNECVKPDYSNVTGVEVLEGDEWEDYYNADGDELEAAAWEPDWEPPR